LKFARTLKRPVDDVFFYKAVGDLITVVVHSRGEEFTALLNGALFVDEDNRHSALKKELKRIVSLIPATPSTRSKRKGSASPSPLPQECRQRT
jgi:hypothetical protein